MQKKSLLVALFCGALCLTGCLKNEESASVAQVRLAKAEELKSLAALNEATAAAKLIYANAEKTIKEAEAKLIEAQAQMVLAQAETEKVRAQLLAVQVQLANVLVEEEKVKLKMMEADLEARLAALAVEKAAADAAKQAWVNVLNDLVAQAQIDAIDNNKKILEAQNKLEDYILTIEGQKADSAKYYAGLYFDALEEVEALQVEELKWKALQVLVNQGAVLTRDAIHEMIVANNEEIAHNNALIAELKEHQTWTPEEAKAALKAARTALEEAYTKYQNALTAEQTAKTTLEDLNSKEADFVQNWDSWKNALNEKAPYKKKNMTVKVDGTPVVVAAYGVNVETEAGVKFVPFFNAETKDIKNSRYPDLTVYDEDPADHIHIKSTVIAPATIQFDNIKTVLDDAVADKQATAEKKIAKRAAFNEKVAEGYQSEIEAIQELQELHKAYIAVREEAVTEAEQAYLKALADAEKAHNDKAAAWVDFQEYMLLTYPTLTSNLFIDRWAADTHYVARQAVADEYAKKVQAVIDRDVDGLKAAVKPLFEEYAAAIGDYRAVIDAITGYKSFWEMNWQEMWQWFFTRQDIPSDAHAAYDAWLASMDVWSPEFADSKKEPEMAGETWVKGEIEAGTSQAAVLTAKFIYDRAKELEYAAYIDFLSGAISEDEYKAAQQDVADALTAIENAEAAQDQAWLDYVEAYNKISEILGIFVNEIDKYYKEDFEVFDYVVFPTDALYDPEGKVDYAVRETVLVDGEEYPVIDAKGNWCFDAKTWPGTVPGLAQRALLNAVKAVVDYYADLKDAQDAYAPKLAEANTAKKELTAANNALIVALGGKAGEDIDKYLDAEAEKLYEAYLAAKKVVVDVEGAYDDLWEAYRAYPDHIGVPTDHNHPYDEPQNFGWLISNYEVDYTATYLGRDGKEHSIAKLLYGKKHPYRYSMQYAIDEYQEMIDEVLPAQLAAYEAAQNKEVKTFKNEVTALLKKIDAYKPLEAQYKTWVDQRNAADKAYNQARIDSFEANEDYIEAKANFEAVEAVANEYVWVYDPQTKDFVKVPVAKAIARLEAKNEELEAENEFLRNVLTDGETVLATVNQILDEKIEVISNNVKILTAIAGQYKAIMNSYLGIEETTATEE